MPGQEGAGVVEAVGPGVTEVAVGDRVAYAGLQGAYAEVRLRAGRASGEAAAGDRRQDGRRDDAEGDDGGVPAAALRARRARRHDPVPRRRGRRRQHRLPVGASTSALRVIGTAGGPEKVARARRAAATTSSTTTEEDVVARVKELTGGAGVSAVFDGVGKRTFDASLDCLATRGMLVLFGQSSGVGAAVRSGARWRRASLFLTRPVARALRRDARRAGHVGAARCSTSWRRAR